MSDRDDLLKVINDKAVVRGDVVLSSGQRASWYIDLRRVLLSGASASAAAAATAACFVAMVVHSLGYAGFTTDPATWALLGVGLALRSRLAASAAADTARDPSAPRSPRDPRPAAV